MFNKFFYFLFIFLIICGTLLITVYLSTRETIIYSSKQSSPSTLQGELFGSSTLIDDISPSKLNPNKLVTVGFWGDVMLARNVELLSDIYGGDYPFLKIKDLFTNNDFNLVNFEGTVPVYHSRTLSNVMKFSVSEDLLSQLKNVNVTHASLANNHGLDFGSISYNNTRQKLFEQDIVSFGHPNKIDADSIIYLDLGKYKLAVLSLHTLYSTPNDVDLENVFRIMSTTSDLQIVYVHWGMEYEPLHSQSQAILAEKLISLGAEGIIGHHPHVAQDVGLIDGVPVFYSLGNTIFDQYFTTAVQEGYAVNLSINNNYLEFTLLPITSIDSHSQPRVMNNDEYINFLDILADKSNSTLQENIKQGKLIFPFMLASSS